MNEEERRRQIAKNNLRLLEEQNMDVRKTLQQELDNLKVQKIAHVAVKVQNAKQQKLTCRLSPSCLTYNDGTIYVGTKCGSILVFDSRTLKLQKTIFPRKRDDPQPVPPENVR